MTHEVRHSVKGWRVQADDHTTSICAADGRRICGFINSAVEEVAARQAADANMIAASVDLYEMVKYLRQQLWQEWHSHMTEEMFLTDATVIAIDTALAKAEGRSLESLARTTA